MSDMFGSNPTTEEQNVSAQPTGEATSQQEEVKQPESNDPNNLFANQLAGIKADDGRQKYADVSTALESIPHAQNKIKELSGENEALKLELEKLRGMEEMLERMQSSQNTPTEQPSTGVLDETKVQEMLESQLARIEQTKTAEANRKKVVDALVAKYGDKAEEVFNTRAKEVGLGADVLTNMAYTHPDFVLKQFDAAAGPAVNTTTSTVNTSGIKPNPPEKRPVVRGATYKDVVEQYRLHGTQ